MRISIKAVIEGDAGSPPREVAVGLLERVNLAAPASGLGLMMVEAHAVLQQLQTVVLDEQVDSFIKAGARCFGCGTPLGIKETKHLMYRTAFGKAKLRSPRFYTRCTTCGESTGDSVTVSPLACALPQRVHPQWQQIQGRYASVMSYRLAQIFLRDAFPGGRQLQCSSLKANVRAIGDRLEGEAQNAKAMAGLISAPSRRPQLKGTPAQLQIDAGYIKSTKPLDGTRWFPVIASKIVRPDVRHTHAHAYATATDPRQGLRQQAF